MEAIWNILNLNDPSNAALFAVYLIVFGSVAFTLLFLKYIEYKEKKTEKKSLPELRDRGYKLIWKV